METYLNDYMQVLPESDRRRVQDILKYHQGLWQADETVTEASFAELIDRVVDTHSRVTRFLPQIEHLDPDAFNRFMENVSVDIHMLFLESILIETAVQNYGRMYDAMIDSLRQDLKRLELQIDELTQLPKGETTDLTRSVQFDSDQWMATDKDRNPHLFVDRDGSELPMASITRYGTNRHATLARRSNTDVLRDANGATTASIAIEDVRGTPVGRDEEAGTQNQTSITNALDGTDGTYWGEMVLANDPIKTRMHLIRAARKEHSDGE